MLNKLPKKRKLNDSLSIKKNHKKHDEDFSESLEDDLHHEDSHLSVTSSKPTSLDSGSNEDFNNISNVERTLSNEANNTNVKEIIINNVTINQVVDEDNDGLSRLSIKVNKEKSTKAISSYDKNLDRFNQKSLPLLLNRYLNSMQNGNVEQEKFDLKYLSKMSSGYYNLAKFYQLVFENKYNKNLPYLIEKFLIHNKIIENGESKGFGTFLKDFIATYDEVNSKREIPILNRDAFKYLIDQSLLFPNMEDYPLKIFHLFKKFQNNELDSNIILSKIYENLGHKNVDYNKKLLDICLEIKKTFEQKDFLLINNIEKDLKVKLDAQIIKAYSKLDQHEDAINYWQQLEPEVLNNRQVLKNILPSLKHENKSNEFLKAIDNLYNLCKEDRHGSKLALKNFIGVKELVEYNDYIRKSMTEAYNEYIAASEEYKKVGGEDLKNSVEQWQKKFKHANFVLHKTGAGVIYLLKECYKYQMFFDAYKENYYGAIIQFNEYIKPNTKYSVILGKEDNDIEKDVYKIAIYSHIKQGEYTEARILNDKALETYPASKDYFIRMGEYIIAKEKKKNLDIEKMENEISKLTLENNDGFRGKTGKSKIDYSFENDGQIKNYRRSSIVSLRKVKPASSENVKNKRNSVGLRRRASDENTNPNDKNVSFSYPLNK